MSCPLHSNDNSCAGCAKVKIQRLERQLAEAREVINKEKEFNQIIVDANEQYIEKYKQKDKEILKLKILVQQERYENQENKLNSIRLSRSHERVMEEEDKLKHIAKVINKLVEQLKESE